MTDPRENLTVENKGYRIGDQVQRYVYREEVIPYEILPRAFYIEQWRVIAISGGYAEIGYVDHD